MEKILSNKKLTLSSLKSFAERNNKDLCIRNLKDGDAGQWHKTEIDTTISSEVKGVYIEGKDTFKLFQNDSFVGVQITNKNQDVVVAVKK